MPRTLDERSAPRVADYPIQSRDKVRYADTDRQGHVNNAAFAVFLETGRVETLYNPKAPIADEGASFVIVRLQLEFRAEITWPGDIIIGTRVLRVGRSSITLEQALFQEETCVAVAEGVVVHVDDSTRRSRPLSPQSIDRLKGLGGSES